MHIEGAAVPGWTDALVRMPDGALLKAFDPGKLTDGREKWAAAGRAQDKLFTIYRHFDVVYPFDRIYTWEEHKAIWRANFARFVDGTYLAQHATNVSAVETLNEHTDTRMVTDKVLLAPHLLTEQAAVVVWNTEYRGKLVPAGCRLVIVNGPEGNDIPVEFFRLAIESDSLLGYHPYTLWINQQRQSGDWTFISGRWNFMEQEYGLRPVWAFTESGPFYDAGKGWRAAECLAGDEALLVQAMRGWVHDVAQTAAYREGRVMGPGAWFTSGGTEWADYQLEAAQLTAIADMTKDEWKQEYNMDAQLKADIAKHAQAILDLVNPPWWMAPALPFVAVARTLPLTTFNLDHTVHDVRPNASYDLNVTARTIDGWLTVAPALLVRAADVKLKGA